MVSVALFFDALQWLLSFVFMHWLATIFAYMTFGLWFYLKGIKLMTPKRLSTIGGTFILEIIPFIAVFPAITAMVVITILDVKAKKIISATEEKLGI